ncbi:MAG: ubiquinol-cytochrome c reductase iron-sulfur subunit [Nitrospiraceae bacterium]|nr:MAG: ubiquinol-cytochrome c reductase iron-sulfur subunit [Nitrospiraceae bacterium]
MASVQPKIKSKVRCVDGEVGEIAHVIADPISLEVSHIVVRTNGTQRQVPVSTIATVREDSVELRCNASQVADYPELKREDFLTSKEVEIPHLENKVHVEPGDLLVPFPQLEKSCARRNFFTGFIHVIGALIGLPLVWPVLRFIMKPMYAPYDNRWIKIGNVSKIKTDDVGVQFIFKKSFTDSVLLREEDKNHWVIKATPETLKKIYQHGDISFMDEKGDAVWVNKQTVPYVAFAGKCPHLGCGFKWRTHKKRGQVFLCPCHLSIYDSAGKVLDGPAPRPLDVLPIKVSATGEIEIIDVEYKAGKKEQVRIA